MDYPKALKKSVIELSRNEALTGFVNGQGNPHAELMLVGEAPGKVEIETKIPFTGQSGRKLDQWLCLAGLKREEIYITSAVRRRPYKRIQRFNKKTGLNEIVYPNRTPNQREIKCHSRLLDYEIKQIKPKILAPMGNIGLQRLLGKGYKISDYHGKWMERSIQFFSQKGDFQFSEETYLIFPLYHPAAVLYNHQLERVIREDWLRLGKWLNSDMDA